MPGVRARRHLQFDTWAAPALHGEEWERVGGLMWNKNHISTQLGADLFVRQFSVSDELIVPFTKSFVWCEWVSVFWLKMWALQD